MNNELLHRNISDIFGSLSLIDIAFIILMSEIFNAALQKVYPGFNQNGFLVSYLPGIIFGLIVDSYYSESLHQSTDFLVSLVVLIFLIILVNRFAKSI